MSAVVRYPDIGGKRKCEGGKVRHRLNFRYFLGSPYTVRGTYEYKVNE